MESYTLIFVRDQHSRPVQMAIPKPRVKQAVAAAVVVVLVGWAGVWDYWRLRADNAELAELRVEAFEQREQIALFEGRIEAVDDEIAKVNELERKVRIIANLPGAAGVGGDDLTELAPSEGDAALPVGVPVDRTQPGTRHEGQGGGELLPMGNDSISGVQILDALGDEVVELVADAGERVESLEALLIQLEDKRQRLVSMPAKGWMTSRFGPRVSPFTGRRQLHNGIDIAAASGTSIYAPARGRVSFAGRKGPLGKALVLDHGFGVKTVYGHTKEIHVSPGDTVERGQEIAAIGSTGRSTGPHLHYVVEIHGKPVDPLDYIFD